MDDSFEIARESDSKESKESSVQDVDDYQERVEQLKRITQPDQEFQIHEESIPEDLKLLQEKIEKKMMKKVEQQKPKKQSYVPVNQIRTAIIVHLFKLYQNHKMVENQIQLGMNISNFKYSIIESIEAKLTSTSTLQEKILAIYLGFSLTYSIRNQFSTTTKHTALEPSEYIIRFAQICKYYELNVRVVRAFDVGFLGLEQKFRIKTIKQDEQEIEESIISKSTSILEKNSTFFNQSDTVESLDDYMYQGPENNKKKIGAKQMTQSINESQQGQQKQQQQQQQSKKNIMKKNLAFKQMNDEIQKNNQFLWLEFHDQSKDEWVPFDPISDRSVSLDSIILKNKLNNSFSHFIIAAHNLSFKDKNIHQERIFGTTYFVDITAKYSMQFNVQRMQLSLQKWFNYFAYKAKLIFKGLSKLVIEPIQSDQLAPPLSSFKQEKDFKYSQFYAIASQLSQYQMIRPDAKPLDVNFKDELVYLQSDVIILHSKDKWREYLREVAEGVLPIKEVGQKFDKTKTTALFALWQTNEIKVSLLENEGNLPVNQYGNYETFAFPPPKGTKLMLQTGMKTLLTKNGFKFAEAVDGFDSQGGRMFAQKCGYLLYEQDYEKVQQLYEEYKIELEEKNRINKRKELMKLWSDLFKSILLKRDLQAKYQILN